MADAHPSHGAHAHGDHGHNHHGHNHPGPHDHGDDDHGHGSMKKYLYVFLALCVLTTASFMTYTDFWRNHFPVQAGWAFMMAVSLGKATLVMLFFMHLKYEANWKYVLTIPATIMAVFLTLALIPDVGNRYNEIIGGRSITHQQVLALPAPASPEPAGHGEASSAGEGAAGH